MMSFEVAEMTLQVQQISGRQNVVGVQNTHDSVIVDPCLPEKGLQQPVLGAEILPGLAFAENVQLVGK